MGFGWPPGLAALAALLVPLLIHLARRRPRSPVLVGTLRHLPGSTAPRRARSRISEPLLLAVRMLVLALLALFIAQPFLDRHRPSRPPRALLVIPSAIPEVTLRRLLPALDSLQAAGLETRELPMADLWSELAELDAGLPPGSSIVVAAPFALPVTGARPALESAVSLHRFDWTRDSSSSGDATQALHVSVIADTSHRVAAARHVAAFQAVAERRGDSLVMEASSSDDGWIAWLSDAAPSPAVLERVRAGGTLLTAGSASSAGHEAVTAQRLGSGLIIEAAAVGAPPVDASFPELIARIWPDPTVLSPTEPEPGRISTSQLLPARVSRTDRADVPRTELGSVLLALAFALFLFERWLSHRPASAPRA
ncbi:MAG TPA: BatA domain-containing protein [Gemmatimonadales bacterium]|nr:BatA domain-containing protein [Gemmatimonadales bacterium]